MKITIAISFFIFLLTGCHTGSRETRIGKPVLADSFPAASPYLTRDPQGNILMSWIRILPDTGYVFCYAVSRDEGRSFGPAITVPGSSNIRPHAENLPKIIRKPSGELIALWGGASAGAANKYAGLVYYARSFDDGTNWTPVKPLVEDSSAYDQRYYDVALLPDGEAAIIWLDNRRENEGQVGSSLYFAKTEGRNGFVHARPVSRECCPCCRTKLLVDGKGNIHVLYRGILNDSIRDMVHAISTDGAKSFSAPKRISNDNWVINACPHTGPTMTSNQHGLHFAWYTGGLDRGCYYAGADENGRQFSERDSISAAGSHPQMTALSSGELVTVWDEPVTRQGKFYKRIGMQRRTTEGRHLEKSFLTADTAIAVYPVLTPVKDNGVLIAFSGESSGKQYLHYFQLAF